MLVVCLQTNKTKFKLSLKFSTVPYRLIFTVLKGDLNN